jgi:hypothetical protein
MKTQLLEDIGDSHCPPASPLQQTEPAPGDRLRQPPANPASTSRRPGTWRQRVPAASAGVGQAARSEPPPARPSPPLFSADIDPLAESWAIANPDAGRTWFERWGRRAAAWSAGLAAALLVSGGAAWMIGERETDQALASVAAVPLEHPPPPVRRAAIAPREPAMLQASDLVLPLPEFHPALPVLVPTLDPARPVRNRRTLAVRKAPSRPEPPAPDPAQERAAQAAETLRQCRAAGYHAEQCIKRSCVATPYGIACKG